MIEYIDNLLKTDDRNFTGDNRLVACGSTGNRVYGSFRKEPGLCGEFNFVHHSNIADLIELEFSDVIYPVKLKTDYEWMPSHIYMKHVYPCFEIEERKYITENDLIVSQVKIRSASGRIKFKASLKSKILDGNFEANLHLFLQTVNIKAFCSCNDLFGTKEIMLEENQEFSFAIACAFKVEGETWPASIPSIEQHRDIYGRFYNGIPYFTCSDKDMEKVYYYRWFLIRHHLANPRLGNIKYPIFYEGRHGYFKKPDMNSKEFVEWEFSRGILASVFHHLIDARWHRDSDIVKGDILNYTQNFGKMRPFLCYSYDVPLLPGCIRIHDCEGHYFFHLMPYIVWQIYKLIKDKDWLEKVEPALWEDLKNWSEYDRENSNLPVMLFEGDTAMEFGPASHYHRKADDKGGGTGFIDEFLNIGLTCEYETDTAKWGPPIPNQRTELASFYGLNYFAFYKIYSEMGNKKKADYCLQRYKEIKEAIVRLMWNNNTGFFMELDDSFRQIEEVKQIGGLFCLLLVDPVDAEGFLDNLVNEGKFNQKFGIASTSRDSFGYAPNNTVGGIRAHTCMWNGPVWPFAVSLSLLALGSYIKRMGSCIIKSEYTEYFKKEFLKYTQLHFLFGNKSRPCIVEHYNCETGTPLSEQDDYNHSCFIDIIIRILCGLDVDEDGKIEFSPVDVGLENIRLENVVLDGSIYCVEIIGKKACLYKNGIKIQECEM